MVKGVVYDTTPLSRFVVPTIFIILPWGQQYSLFHLLCSTPQSSPLGILLLLLSPPVLFPIFFILRVIALSISSISYLTFPNTFYYNLHLTIQITFWQHIIQGILPSSNLCRPLSFLVFSLLHCPYCTLSQILPLTLVHSPNFLYSPKCLVITLGYIKELDNEGRLIGEGYYIKEQMDNRLIGQCGSNNTNTNTI